MILGCYYKCERCDGAGNCEHDFTHIVMFVGEQWNQEGEQRVPTIQRFPCLKCAAHLDNHLAPDGSITRTIVEHPAFPFYGAPS